ncbi:alpha/beta hydrolase [Methylopila sp. 73B]|uniref:alpha/beta fold hydrolase n=1 Tax=Methylopila sp. 73B TaxID=1120792 RepID=UPI00036A78A1|nr:alpha/beta hydrolase [Methylopila sp. 73B]
MPYIETLDKVRLFYNDWGVGKPIVLIHGWPLNADMWEYNASFLAENGFRVIAYDRRGFGRSDQPWSGYDYDTFAADLKALLDGLDLNDAALVGFSMGGGEIARYLARYGADRISKVALVAAVTPFMLKTDEHPNGADKSLFDGFVDDLKKDRPHFLAGFGKQFFGAGLLNFSVSSDILQWAQGLALQASPKATIDCVRAFSETDFRADMATFTVPTLIIHGSGDETVPAKISGQEAAKLVPSATYIEYDGAPHALTYTERDRFNADLAAFLA